MVSGPIRGCQGAPSVGEKGAGHPLHGVDVLINDFVHDILHGLDAIELPEHLATKNVIRSRAPSLVDACRARRA